MAVYIVVVVRSMQANIHDNIIRILLYNKIKTYKGGYIRYDQKLIRSLIYKFSFLLFLF